MNIIQEFTEALGQWLGQRVAQYRWLFLIGSTLICLGLASGLPNISISNDYQIYFSEENPDLNAFKEFQSEYTNNDNILFIVQPKNGDVFTPENAAAIEELTRLAWQIPYVLRVDSITNFQNTYASDDEIVVDDLIRNAETLSQAELNQKKQTALSEPLLVNNLIAEDARTTGINVTLQYPYESITEIPATVTAARDIRDKIQQQYPDMHVAISGIAMLNNAFAEASQNDMASLVPIMYVFIIVVTMFMLRSWAAGISTLLLVTLASLAAMGFAGHSRIAMTPISFIAPTVILTLAIADSIHILLSALGFMRSGKAKIESFVESIKINFLPVSLTSITTIVGFVSLNFSDSPPFAHLGNITAVGILMAWMLSLTFLPALMLLLPLRVKVSANDTNDNSMLTRFANWVIRHPTKILLVGSVMIIGLASQLPKLELNDDFVRYFSTNVEFRTDSEFAIKNLNGIYLVEYSIGSGEADGINDPIYLKNLEAFTQWLNQQPEVRHVFSYTDIIKRLNRNMFDDDPSEYRLPDNKLAAAQLLFLYENSLPSGTNLSDRITTDKSATRVTAAIDDMTAKEGIAFFKRSEAWLRDNTPEPMWTKPTSVSVMFSYISQRNVENMIGGNAFALILISLLLIIGLRHVGFGLLSIIPNTLPIIATYGLWSLLVGQVGMAAAAVSATSLGIIVDDTVHFLAKYLRARRVNGLDKPEAIRYAFNTVGKPILATTVILSFGFTTLMFSDFLINSQMGLLTMISILFALVFDFLFLPALLLIGYKKSEEKVYEPLLTT